MFIGKQSIFHSTDCHSVRNHRPPYNRPERACLIMPQSLARVYIHLVFSTKKRRPYLIKAIRPSLHAYIGAVLKNMECSPVSINSVEDHIHILFRLSRTIALCKVVEVVKKSSSKWIKTRHPGLVRFSWQRGYGAFSVSVRHLDRVRAYIARQEEHHARKSFKYEFRSMLKKYEVDYDERYVWD